MALACYAIAMICIIERDSFVHIPLIIQSNAPDILQSSYLTIAALLAGGGMTVTRRTWEFHLGKSS
jgi:hypothetical protein